MKSIILRIIATLASIGLFGLASKMFNAAAMVYTGGAAPLQFQNSDASFFEFTAINTMFNGGVMPGIILGVILLAIWWGPAKEWIKKLTLPVLAVIALAGLGMPDSSFAYYDKTDRAEWVEVGANQSAFLVPVVGANKDKQKQFGSIEYLEANKVAAKRIQIPHVKADNTGLLSDFYVPSAKLFIVDRTPYMREWSKHAAKGTSTADQGFRFESAESITIETSIGIAAYVKEEDAAKFFYWFGSRDVPGNGPESTFASTAIGKSLADVMDTVVRMRVQTLLAREFGKRKLTVGLNSKAEIIDIVDAAIKTEFKEKGITIQYVGFADELGLDPKLQAAINDVFIANLKFDNSKQYDIVMNIDQRYAEINLINAKAATMMRWNGVINMPSFLVMSDKLMDWMSGLFGGSKK